MYKDHRLLFAFLLIFCLSVISIADESVNIYFPDTVGSNWVYIDQDGNEFTRNAVQGKDIDGTTYRAYTYQPELEDLDKYQHIMHPFLYQIEEKWVAYFVGDDIETATKSILSKKLDETIAAMRTQISEQLPSGITIEFDYTIDPNAQDYFYLFPVPITYNEEWVAMQMKVNVNMTMDISGAPVDPPDELKTISTSTNIEEKGKIVGKETVETKAGKFQDCLKIEFTTNSTTDTNLPQQVKQLLPEQQTKESVSTVWLAPNVGIIKYTSNSDPSNEIVSYELTSYEIK